MPNNLIFVTFFFSSSNRTVPIDMLLVFFFIQTFYLFLTNEGRSQDFQLGGPNYVFLG